MLQESELVTDLLKTLMSRTKVIVPVYHKFYFHALTVLLKISRMDISENRNLGKIYDVMVCFVLNLN